MTLEELFRRYISYGCSWIFENSGDFKHDLIELREQSKKEAESLGLEWRDSFLPDYALEIIND